MSDNGGPASVSVTSTTEEYGALREMMVEIRTRLDVLISQHGEVTRDHEARIRTLEQRADPSHDHEGRLRALEQRVDPTHALTAIDVDHEARIRKLERWVWMAAGAAGAVGGGLGAFLATLAGAA